MGDVKVEIPDEDRCLIDHAKWQWRELCISRNKIKALGYDIQDIVGLQNPNSFIVEKKVRL